MMRNDKINIFFRSLPVPLFSASRHGNDAGAFPGWITGNQTCIIITFLQGWGSNCF